MARWGWLPGAKRYYNFDTHRFASFSQVRTWTQTSIDASSDRVSTLSTMLADGRINLPDWQTRMRDQIKREYIDQYLAGRGGIDQMQAEDWGSIGGQCAREFRHLDDFAREIADGKLSEAQVRARSKMYIKGAHEAYERGFQQTLEDTGIDEERWIMNPLLENCVDCEAFEAEGWQPLGHYPVPASGRTRCLSNCGCDRIFRVSETGETYGVLAE